MAYTTINKSSLHMNTKLYTGDGATSHALTGVGFQPDLCWIKKRSSPATDHNLNTSVNLGSGTASQYVLTSNSNEELQDNGSTYFQSLDSDGFTIGNSDKVNANSATFASWNWKANGAGSANTDGSINTTYTSVNTTAGFSISQWVGTEANATIGHGLGVAPSMIIIKNTEKATSWTVYHKSLGATKALYLESTGTPSTHVAFFNNTEPTSSVFTVGTNDGANGNGEKNIAYCFAEKTGYSKFGSYVGNGSSDGSFCYLGFKPAFVMIKITNDTGENWQMYDNKRTGFNVDNNMLRANLTDAEQTDDDIDLLSNGFKLRRSSGAFNSDGANYIYMAFAEAPLVGTNGVTAKAR